MAKEESAQTSAPQQQLCYLTDAALKTRLDELFVIAETKRKSYEWQWFLDIQFMRGEHYLHYNKTTNRIEVPANLKGRARVRINKTYQIVRAVRRFVTEYRPKWDIGPYGLFRGQDGKKSDDYDDQVHRTNDYADYMYGNILRGDGGKGFDKIEKEIVLDGLQTSVGFVEIYYDADKNEIVADSISPFDVYVLDPQLPLHANRVIWKMAQRYVSEVKANPDYKNTEELKADNKVSQSEIKKMLINSRYNETPGRDTQDDDVSTVLLKEAHIMTEVTKELVAFYRQKKMGSEEDLKALEDAIGETRVRIVTTTEKSDKPLRDEITDDDEYQIGKYSADIQPRETYGEGWIRNLRPLNQVLNRLESGSLDYMNYALKYRLTMQSNSGVEVITNDNGEIIEHTPQVAPPVQLRNDPLPSAYYTKPDQYSGYMEDIGGAHVGAMLGGPGGSGTESGRHVEAVRAGDAQNLADLRENLEETLIWAMNRIMKLTDKYYVDKRLIEVKNKDGTYSHYYVRGQNAYKRLKLKDKEPESEAVEPEENKKKKKTEPKAQESTSEDNIITIGPDNTVKVDVGSWLAHTLSARQDFMLELFDRQVISQQDLLQFLEFGDIQGVLDRVAAERKAGVTRSVSAPGLPPGAAMPGAMPTAAPGAPGAAGGSLNDPSAQLADSENRQMMAGKIVPPTPPDHVTAEHIQVHEIAMAIPQLPPSVAGHLQAHVEGDQQSLAENSAAPAAANPMTAPAAPTVPGAPTPIAAGPAIQPTQ